MNLDSFYRQGLLAVADAPPVKGFVKHQGWKLGVKRFVAGEDMESAFEALRGLETEDLYGILDLLGEFVDTEAGAAAMTDEILATLDALEETRLNPYMSVKPTQLGLGISLDLALENARRILERAKKFDAHICLDMENYPYVEGTIKLFTCLLDEGFDNVSTVLQSYLKRTLEDLEGLLERDDKPTLRIVKGAYNESEKVAFQDKVKVDQVYREMVYMTLDAGAKANVATHDEAIINEVSAYVRGAGLGPERYEFQLLYGVKPALQKRLVDEGHVVRIYVPYGEDWYGYFSRRLAERPANLMFVVRGMFG